MVLDSEKQGLHERERKTLYLKKKKKQGTVDVCTKLLNWVRSGNVCCGEFYSDVLYVSDFARFVFVTRLMEACHKIILPFRKML